MKNKLLLLTVLPALLFSCKKDEFSYGKKEENGIKKSSYVIEEFFPDNEDHANQLATTLLDYTSFHVAKEPNSYTYEDSIEFNEATYMIEAASNYLIPNWSEYSLDTLLTYDLFFDNLNGEIIGNDMALEFESMRYWIEDQEGILSKNVKIVDVNIVDISSTTIHMIAHVGFGGQVDFYAESWPTSNLTFGVYAPTLTNKINGEINSSSQGWVSNALIMFWDNHFTFPSPGLSGFLITPYDSDNFFNCNDCLYHDDDNIIPTNLFDACSTGVRNLTSNIISEYESQNLPFGASQGLQLKQVIVGSALQDSLNLSEHNLVLHQGGLLAGKTIAY